MKNTQPLPILGFTEDYYTLWVGFITQDHTGDDVIKYGYRQNVAMDLVAARQFMNGKYGTSWIEDFAKRGEMAWQIGEKFDIVEEPKNYDKMQFGKYVNIDLNEVNDVDYLKWYRTQFDRDFFPEAYDIITARLIKLGLIDFGPNNEFIGTHAEADKYWTDMKWKSAPAYSNITAHNTNARIELNVELINVYSFEGYYGITHIMEFSIDGHKAIYMGARPPAIGIGESATIVCTIDMGSYDGVPQTKLKRIRIL